MTQQPILKLPLTYEAVMGRIIDADGHNVCMVYSSIQTRVSEAARAASIVEACNNYEGLLTAADEASKALHEFHPFQLRVGGVPVGRGICEWRPCKDLFAAIAKKRPNIAKARDATP